VRAQAFRLLASGIFLMARQAARVQGQVLVLQLLAAGLFAASLIVEADEE
jgi:hypothetical protein